MDKELFFRPPMRNDTRPLLERANPIVCRMKDSTTENRHDVIHYIVKDFLERYDSLESIDGNTEGLGAN